MSFNVEPDYSDHDLLIVIAERTRMWGERLMKIEERITTLERRGDTQTGFLAGGKFIWMLIASLPAAVVAFVFSGKH